MLMSNALAVAYATWQPVAERVVGNAQVTISARTFITKSARPTMTVWRVTNVAQQTMIAHQAHVDAIRRRALASALTIAILAPGCASRAQKQDVYDRSPLTVQTPVIANAMGAGVRRVMTLRAGWVPIQSA